MYNNGFDFFRDLLVIFGTDAERVASEYLTMQEDDDRKNDRFRKDPEECQFCRELWQAVQLHKATA